MGRLEVLLSEALARGESVSSAHWHGALMAAGAARRQGCLGLKVSPIAEEDALAAAAKLGLDEALGAWPDALFEDPHALGWLHQGWSSVGRLESFEGHVQRGERHGSATVSTQLYTPRWVADALARRAMAGGEATRVLDPAVGGAQMLLAALQVWVDQGRDPLRAVSGLWGWDLDPRAVAVARLTLKLELARLLGRRTAEGEARIDAQIVCRDALVGESEVFDVVLTNPPYMGWRSMPEELRALLKERYRPFERDLYAAFIKRCQELASQSVGLLVQQGIFYLKGFQAARRALLEAGELRDFLHLGAGAFWGLSGEKASVVGFVQTMGEGAGEATRVWDLRGLRGPQDKERAYRERAPQRFEPWRARAVPGRPFCYELPGELLRWFDEAEPLDAIAEVPGGQNKTGANRRFVRRFDQVDPAKITHTPGLWEEGEASGRWRFYSKGGRFAPWWGNWEWVVDWSEQAREFYASNRTSNLLSEAYVGREGICYTDFAGGRFNARWMPAGCVFDMTGPAIFVRPQWLAGLSFEERNAALLGVLNSGPARRLLRALNPTLHFQVSDVRALPVPRLSEAKARRIAALVRAQVAGVRRAHQGLGGSVLQGQAALSAGELRALLARLKALEAALEAEVAELYEVGIRPPVGASVEAHHALVGLYRGHGLALS
ncbi:hypothetical protein DL240_09300 [Lujinxingia litoralis]|uniref:site-specific DNA-methyltransferase (adenine-specific) n=1 Tax=Lujinxingia litoralis TaxID=2211119 RepID=A0A328C640_9DELT|nr:hypothetical protein DL240_09300 [Lujinxingia litoralis]